jgi:hypothetical protein
VFVARATKKLRDRLGPVTLQPEEESTTRLGEWYACGWLWKPQVALFVSEATLFPVLTPLAPAVTLLAPFPDHLAQALLAQDVPETFITDELALMQDVRLAPTASRSVLGAMNEFTFMAKSTRADTLGPIRSTWIPWQAGLLEPRAARCSSATSALTASCGHSWTKRPEPARRPLLAQGGNTVTAA